MIYKHKNIFELLKEAEEDETSATGQNDTEQTQEESPNPEESNDDGAEDDYGGEDDFNIDADLDADDSGGDDGSGEESTDTGSSDSDSGAEDSEEEPVEANTDIFASLSAEEQQIKIKELKRQFSDLYTSTDDLLAKINDTETNEDNLEVMTRISMTMYCLKQYIADYMTSMFANKSYVENDITFNRFLTILNSISVIIEEIVKLKEDKTNN